MPHPHCYASTDVGKTAMIGVRFPDDAKCGTRRPKGPIGPQRCLLLRASPCRARCRIGRFRSVLARPQGKRLSCEQHVYLNRFGARSFVLVVIAAPYADAIRARISSTRQAVTRGPNFTGLGKRPVFTPFHQQDFFTGIIGGIGGSAFGSPMICGNLTKPVSGSECICIRLV